MKKRGFGVGFYNGIGGKQEPGEEMEQAAARECNEEINVIPLETRHVGVLDFYFEDINVPDQKVYVYICSEWDGHPTESEEMKPEWFKTSEIPYPKMWPGDNIWLPLVLNDKYVNGTFYYDKENKLTKHQIELDIIPK
jgi:8-oxo-dGTP diphosphatase/2-hydroxy-dATP diphosphatase